MRDRSVGAAAWAAVRVVEVVGGDRVRVLEHVAGQDADRRSSSGAIAPSATRRRRRRPGVAAEAGSQPMPTRSISALASMISSSVTVVDHAAGRLDRAPGAGHAGRVADLDRGRDRLGHDRRERVPARSRSRRRRARRRRPGSSASRGMRSIRPTAWSSTSALPKAAVLPRLPPGRAITSGICQPQLLEQLEDDRLLPLEAERVDRVDEVDVVAVGQLAQQGQRLVEVALDLDDPRAVGDRLRQLAAGDLALRHQHQRRHARRRRVGGERGRGVAGRGAGDDAGADRLGVADADGHAAVLEGRGRVLALVLELEVTVGESGVARPAGRPSRSACCLRRG